MTCPSIGLSLYRPLDNVATTTGVRPGTRGHGRCAVSLRGQKAWARQLNPERGEPMILNVGGTADTAFLAKDSDLRIATATRGWLPAAHFRTAIRHTRGDRTTILRAGDLPSRGFDKSRGPQYLIPLYK